MHPQLINMDLQEGMVINGIYNTTQNIYVGSCKCIWQIFYSGVTVKGSDV
jgi:hypothetical protein